jgi:hypothetical protein
MHMRWFEKEFSNMRFAIGWGNSQTWDIGQENTKYERLVKCFAFGIFHITVYILLSLDYPLVKHLMNISCLRVFSPNYTLYQVCEFLHLIYYNSTHLYNTIIIIIRHPSYCYHYNVIHISPITPQIYIIQLRLLLDIILTVTTIML